MSDYTVREIADLLGVSKTTVSKYMKAFAIEPDYVKNNRQYYNFEKVKTIIKLINPDYDEEENAWCDEMRNNILTKSSTKFISGHIVDRLEAYENTGLEPDEIEKLKSLKESNMILRKNNDEYYKKVERLNDENRKLKSLLRDYLNEELK